LYTFSHCIHYTRHFSAWRCRQWRHPFVGALANEDVWPTDANGMRFHSHLSGLRHWLGRMLYAQGFRPTGLMNAHNLHLD
jgi:Zn-dependent M32 family carboxypeptidase